MPASTLSSNLSWAAYILAGFALCLALSPVLSAYSSGAALGAGLRAADCVSSVIDELKPGMQTSITLASGGVTLGGRSVTFGAGNASVTQAVSMNLPSMTLSPGKTYQLYIEGGSVEVVSTG